MVTEQIESMLLLAPNEVYKGLSRLFPPSLPQEEEKARFASIPPETFQRLIKKLETGSRDLLWPSNIYSLVSDQQIEGLEISKLDPRTIIRFFLGSQIDEVENRRRFSLIRAEEVFKCFLEENFPSSDEERSRLCQMISDRQFTKCPLSEFSKAQFWLLFCKSLSIQEAQNKMAMIPVRQIQEFYKMWNATSSHSEKQQFLQLCSDVQKSELRSLVIFHALDRKRCS